MHKYPKFTLLCPGHVKICENFCYCHITLMGSEYGVHMSLLSYFTNLEFLSEILSLVVMSMCTFIVCCRISAFCCALILCIIPGCQRRGQVTEPKVPDYTHCGPKGSDGLAASSAVRKPGGGTSRAWDIILWHPTHRGPLGSLPCSTAVPHRAVFAS